MLGRPQREKPQVDSRWQVQLLGCLVEGHVAFVPALPVTSWVTILSLALLWQSGHFWGVRGCPLGSSYVQVSVHSPWGQGLVLTACPPAAVHIPLVLCIVTILPWQLRTVVPLPRVLPSALPGEALALGSGLTGLAVSP